MQSRWRFIQIQQNMVSFFFKRWSSSGMCTSSLIVKNIQKMLQFMYALHTWGTNHLKEVYHLIPFLNILLFLRDNIIFKDINKVYNTE